MNISYEETFHSLYRKYYNIVVTERDNHSIQLKTGKKRELHRSVDHFMKVYVIFLDFVLRVA